MLKKNNCCHYGWLVVVGSFMSHFIVLGVSQTFGIMYSELLVYFNSGKGETSWIASLNVGVSFGVGPIAGVIAKKFGCHTATFIGAIIATLGMASSMFVPEIHFLYLTYGIVTGAGFGCLHHIQHTVVQFYFTTRRSLATAVASMGGGIGTIALPLLTHTSLHFLDWSGTFLILAGLCFHGVICACCYWSASRHQNDENKRNTAKMQISIKDKTDITEIKEAGETFSLMDDIQNVIRNFQFVIFTISCALVTLVYYIPFVILPDFVKSKGYTKHDCALLITIAGVSGVFGRLITGLVSDGLPQARLFIHGVMMIIGGSLTAVCSVMDSYVLFSLYAAVLGIFTGSIGMFVAVICMDLVGKHLLSVAFGLQTCFQSVFLIVGPPVGGLIADITQSYDGTLYYSGIVFVLAGAISIFVHFMPRRREYLLEKVVVKDESRKSSVDKGVFYLDSSKEIQINKI